MYWLIIHVLAILNVCSCTNCLVCLQNKSHLLSDTGDRDLFLHRYVCIMNQPIFLSQFPVVRSSGWEKAWFWHFPFQSSFDSSVGRAVDCSGIWSSIGRWLESGLKDIFYIFLLNYVSSSPLFLSISLTVLLFSLADSSTTPVSTSTSTRLTMNGPLPSECVPFIATLLSTCWSTCYQS